MDIEGGSPTRGRASRGRDPNWMGLAALALTAFALLATTPGLPTLERQAFGEVTLSGSESVERALHIHIEPRGGGATSGSIELSFQAASGLQDSYAIGASIGLVGAPATQSPYDRYVPLPIDVCVKGCDLSYRIRITAGPGTLPLSVLRYVVGVRLTYQYGPSLDPGLMRLDLEGATSGPVAPLWSVLAGLLALALGLRAGPRLDRALARDRRRWPAHALSASVLGLAAWMIVSTAVDVIPQIPDLWAAGILAVVDPWSVLLLLTLAWGVWLGTRRWADDDGWLLGLAAVAATGLGGLWLAWWTTLGIAVQPIGLALVFALFGGLGGLVIGQAWRTGPTTRHDRWWATFAILGHGIVIAGFGFVVNQALYAPWGFGDPFIPDIPPFLTLIPAGLVAITLHRWLGGRRRWLVFFDLVIVAIGLLGFMLWSEFNEPTGQRGFPIEIGHVGVVLAVVASIVALVTAFHAMPRTAQPWDSASRIIEGPRDDGRSTS